jgi:hypothetical protein
VVKPVRLRSPVRDLPALATVRQFGSVHTHIVRDQRQSGCTSPGLVLSTERLLPSPTENGQRKCLGKQDACNCLCVQWASRACPALAACLDSSNVTSASMSMRSHGRKVGSVKNVSSLPISIPRLPLRLDHSRLLHSRLLHSGLVHSRLVHSRLLYYRSFPSIPLRSSPHSKRRAGHLEFRLMSRYT